MARTPDRFTTKVMEILKDPSAFPPEVSAWVRGLIARNPAVRLSENQLPFLDKKHYVGATGEPAFAGTWVNFGTFESAFFYKDSYDRVYLQGLVKSGTIPSTIFTLPAAYRPVAQLLFDVQSNAALGRVDINTDGTVVATTGNTAWVNLSGISFRTA